MKAITTDLFGQTMDVDIDAYDFILDIQIYQNNFLIE